MPLVSASNENQAKYCALMFLGVSLKIPAIFQIEYFKKGNLLQICPWLVLLHLEASKRQVRHLQIIPKALGMVPRELIEKHKQDRNIFSSYGGRIKDF